MNNNEKKTIPSIPAAIRKSHRPTLVFKTNIEVQEELRNSAGRYSIIEPRQGA